MSPAKKLEPELLAELTRLASKATGFSPEAIFVDALHRSIQPLLDSGHSPEALLDMARNGDARITDALVEKVSVGETFFFRQAEHFKYLAEHFLPEFRASGKKRISAWSAGCATGEEAYSLAACLLANLQDESMEVRVLGTDASPQRIHHARNAVYRDFSIRVTGPMLFPLLESLGNGRFGVLRVVKEKVRFAVHDLHQSPPFDEQFDVIFCRNVLVYFSQSVGQSISRKLVRALAPGGLLAFGAVDISEAPEGVQRAASTDANLFRMVPPQPKAAPRPPAAPLPLPERPARARSAKGPNPVSIHTHALGCIERGQYSEAAQMLSELAKVAPDYLPGVLERALLHARRAEHKRAHELMRQILHQTERLPEDLLLAGPEPLPVSYYRASAVAFMSRREVEE
jgi:chemotaxis methyl-accepting protein methylase